MPIDRERMFKHALVLALMLMAQTVLGVILTEGFSSLTYPGTIIPYAIVIWLYLRSSRGSDQTISKAHSIRYGEAVVRYASLLFGLFVLLSSSIWSRLALRSAVILAIGSILISWLVGVVWVVLLTLLYDFLRIKKGIPD